MMVVEGGENPLRRSGGSHEGDKWRGQENVPFAGTSCTTWRASRGASASALAAGGTGWCWPLGEL